MSQPRPSQQIRDEFLRFFEQKQHTVVPSAPLVPQDDPTLLFTNAGMNQFKDVFLGTGTRPYVRAVDTQKCLRVSGKHNDLEEVGVDTYHHTFFEMLGNWSFGDYFKREAIRWAWELLTDVWGLDPGRLYASVHEGDEKLGLDPDEEAAQLWKTETGINPEHVLYFGSKDNFWMMGDTGPCGPCSEIHVDLRSEEDRAATPGAQLVNADHPEVIEIWNLVFIQYNAHADGSLEPLAAKHVDTGMGFERVCAVLQGKSSTYDTDLFGPLLQAIADLSPVRGLAGYDRMEGLTAEQQDRYRIALRVIADHIRTIAFAIADGASPNNEGRGYVIRRILRRAVRFGYQTLALREPFLYQLVPVLIDKMGEAFPEIARQQEAITRTIKSEEESFLRTLGTGVSFFERLVPHVRAVADGDAARLPMAQEALRQDRQTLDLLGKAYVDDTDREAIVKRFAEVAAKAQVPGEVAFLLHDTYGFPIDLTQLMAREEGLGVDMPRYNVLMERQRTRAREAGGMKVDLSSVDTWQQVQAGEDSQFIGYDVLACDDARVMAIREAEGREGVIQHQLVLDATPFYAESGGQVGDTGFLRVGEDEVQVLDTLKQQDGRIVHIVDRLPAELDAPVTASVDVGRRQRIMKHHTVTHLMHAALREVLGDHVAQKGSLVAPEYLRFDFSHFEKVKPEELRAVEQRVNEVIQRNIVKQEERAVPIEEALERGAMALFGEKYGDRVRVITFDPDFSLELCGGTHVGATGEIGLFRFLSEGSIAAGVRRVEAVAGMDAYQHLLGELGELDRVRGQFRTRQRPSDEEVADVLAANKRLEKELEAAQQQSLAAGLDGLIEGAAVVGAVRVVHGRIPGASMEALRTLGQELRARMGAGHLGVLGTTDAENGKVYLVAAVSDDLTKQVPAGKLVGALAKKVGGGGGGRPQLATAGGRQPENLDAALAAVPEVVAEMLG